MTNVIDRVLESRYALYHGDCIEVLKGIPSNSVHYSIFSPPFANLYTYSNSDRDMGNCVNDAQFVQHMNFLAPEVYRVIMPGRLVSVHCMDLPLMKSKDGMLGLKDFPATLREIFEAAGFIYHSKVTIWKDPVVEMQRTKSLGLLHKQLKKDSCRSRQGTPDYIITLYKPGDNPEPVTHTNESFPVTIWQQYASPVWMDIRQGDTLQRQSARDEHDEMHICPLQLEVIRRCIALWTNETDIVLDPFSGIGSTGHEAVKYGRNYVGIELKTSYFKQSTGNLKMAVNEYNKLQQDPLKLLTILEGYEQHVNSQSTKIYKVTRNQRTLF